MSEIPNHSRLCRRPPRRGVAGLSRRPRGSVAGLVIVLAALLSACGGGGSPAVARLPPLHPGRIGPETMFTPSNEIIANPAGTLDELQRLGVDTVHLYLHWADVAPDPSSRARPSFDATNPAAYPASGWAVFDAIVGDVKARGMRLVLDLIAPPPAWASARGAPDPKNQPYWRPSASEFGQFVHAVGTRYSGHYSPPGAPKPLPRADFWSIWNEPNLGFQLAPQAVPHTKIELSGAIYRRLVDAAWGALRSTGHGHDTILIGETGPAGATFADAPGLFGAMAPLRFLRALYCVDAAYAPLRGAAARQRGCPTTAAGSAAFAAAHPGLFHATAFADHPYPQGLPPNESAPGEPDYAVLAEVPKLERTLDTLQRVYGSSTRFPIYDTEYGYQTTPPDQGTGTVSPAAAAYYLNWSEYLTWLDPRLRSYDQYLLTDAPSGVFASGLKYANGAPKPGYDAFRLPVFLPVTSTRAGSPLEVWGCVRAAEYARRRSHRPQRVTIEFQNASGGGFKTVQTVPVTDRYGYFDVLQRFSGSGIIRVAWSYPQGPRIFSRAVRVTLR